jgi:acyl dehydratase
MTPKALRYNATESQGRTQEMTVNLAPLPQTYFEDVKIGDELPGFGYKLTWTEMVKQVSGSQDFYAVHHDPEFARSGGHKDIFYNTGWTRAQLFRVLSDFAGPEGWVRKLHFEMRRMNRPNDTIQVKGKVVDRKVTEEGNEVTVELCIENDEEGVATPAHGVVFLPSRP